MNWLRKWLDRRRVTALQEKVTRMKIEAKEAELVPLMPAMETISRRIRLERLVVLEKALGEIDRLKADSASRRHEKSDDHAVSA